MIFATCGSSHFPFERMMDALAVLPADQLYVQHGPAVPPSECAGADAFLPFDEMVKQIERADVVISHAGVGSILCAIRAGHTPIIFPRFRRYAEHVDDHQSDLAEALASRGTAVIARSPGELADVFASLPPRRRGAPTDARVLAEAVRAAIFADTPPHLVERVRA